ncbi:MAG: DUF2232 domain-containing protein [Candidatus Hydrogenedentota bacterium]
MAYAFVAAVITGLSLLSAKAGLVALAPVIFPVPVAFYWGAGEKEHAGGLVLLAGLAGLLGTGSVQAAVFFTGTAVTGLALGHAIAHRWTFSRCLAVVAVGMYALSVAGTLATWNESRAAMRDYLNQPLQAMRQAQTAEEETPPADHAQETVEEKPAEETAIAQRSEGALKRESAPEPASEATPENIALLEEQVRWFIENWAAIAIGGMLWPVLLFALAVTGISARLIRFRGEPGPRGSFTLLRVPDPVVWLAIAAALLWLVDFHWPNGTVRFIAWNSALALAAIYWLQGLAVLAYTLTAIRVPPLLAMLALVLVFMTQGAHLLLSSVGFFDTWADFRPRLTKAIAARAQRKENGHDGHDDND